MKKFFGTGNETPEEIIDLLSSNADEVTEDNYFKKSTELELQQAHEDHTKNSIKLAQLDDTKKKFVTDHEAIVKPLKIETKELLQLLKNKGVFIRGNVYKLIDQEAGRVGFYAPDGNLINERPIFQDEKNPNIIGAIRAANEGK